MDHLRGFKRHRFLIGFIILTLLAEISFPVVAAPSRQKVEASGAWDATPYYVALPDNQVRVSWYEPEYGMSGKQYRYEVAFYALPGRELLAAPGSYLPGSSTEWVQTGLDPATRYEVRITAIELGETEPYDTLISEVRLLDFDMYHMDMRITYTGDNTIMKVEWNGSKREGMFNTSIYSYDVAVWEAGPDDEPASEVWKTSERYYRTQNSKYSSLIDGISPGQRYMVTIRLYNLLDFMDSALEMYVTVPGADVDPVEPAAPPAWPENAELHVSSLSSWEGFKLEWPQAAGEIDHYELSWSRNDGETVTEQLPAGQLEQLFGGPPDYSAPGDVIAYSVRAVGEPTEDEPLGLKSEPLGGSQIIPRLALDIDTIGSVDHIALKAGTPIGIALEASPGYAAQAVIRYESWYNEAGQLQASPVQREREVALSEQPAEPGKYAGTWMAEEQERITFVSDVYVKLSKGGTVISAGDTITDAEGVLWGFPFTGELIVDVAGDVAGASLFISAAYGSMPPVGRILDGPGRHTFSHWYPGEVTVSVKKDQHTYLVEPTSARVESSGTTTLVLQAEPPELPPQLGVKVRESSGEPIEGVAVQAFVNGGWRTGRTDSSGEIIYRNKLISGASIDVRVLDIPLPYKLPATLTHVMGAGHNELVIDLEPRPMLEVSGQVKLDFAPAQDMPIEFTQIPPPGSLFDAPYQAQAVTNQDGAYTIRLYDGISATVGFGEYNAYYDETGVSLPIGEEDSSHSFDLYSRSEVSIKGTIRKHLRGVWRESIPWEELGLVDFQQRVVTVQKMPGGRKQYFLHYPVSVKGKPGEQFQVCIKDAQFIHTCDLVTIDNDFTGHAILDFYELGSELKLSFGQELAQAGATYRITGLTNGFVADYMVQSSGEAERIALPAAGEYTLTVHTLQQGRMQQLSVRRFHIREGELLDLGRIDTSQSDQVKGYMTLDHLTYYPGEEIRLRLGITRGSLQELPSAGSLKIKVPDGLTVYGIMPSIDGSLIPDYNQQQPADGVLTIPLSRLQLIGFDSGDWLYLISALKDHESGDTVDFHSWLEYTADGVDIQEPLGAAQAELQAISIEAPDRISSRKLQLHGKAIPGSRILVYHQDTLLGQTHAGGTKLVGMMERPSGTWSLNVELPAPPEGTEDYTYELYAVANTAGQQLESRHVTTRLSTEGLPRMTEVSLATRGYYQTQLKTFDPSKGIPNFPYILEPGVTEVAVTFNDPRAVSNVVVHISPFTLPAVLGEDGVYRAYIYYTNHFAITELSGGVYVSYDSVPAVDGDASFEQLEQLRDALPWWLKDAEAPRDGDVQVIEQSRLREEYRLNQSLPARLGTSASLDTSFYVESQVEYDIDRKPKMKIADKTVYGTKGSASFAAGSRSPFPGAPTGYRDSAAMVSSFIRSSNSRNMTVKAEFSGYVQYEDPGNGGEVRILSAPLQIAKTGANIVVEGIDIGLTLEGSGGFEATMDSIQDRIKKVYAGCHSQRAQRYHGAYEDIMSDMMAAETAKWAASLGLFAIGAGAPGPGTMVAGLTLVAGQGLGKVIDREMANELAEVDLAVMRDVLCEEDTLNPKEKPPLEPKQKVDDKRNLVATPVWIYDPSGFAYETVPEDRLEGVTATVLYKDESADEWVEWDAEWFEQKNPQITGNDGRYHWDVPPGLWKIQLEKEGYATAYSDELRVLPPHFDVNLAMVALTAPVAQRARSEDNGQTLMIDFSKYTRLDDENRPVNGIVRVMRGEEEISGNLTGFDVIEVDQGKLAKRWVYEIAEEHGVRAGDVLDVIVYAGAAGYNDIALASDQQFEVTVTASDVTPPAMVPSAEVLAGDQSLFVIWRDPSDEDLSKIKVEWKGESDQSYRERIVGAGVGIAELAGLRAGELYQVRISALDAADNASSYVELLRRVDAAQSSPDRIPPLEVSGASAEVVGQTIRVSWADPASPDLEGVLIRWREAGADEDAGAAQIDPGEQMFMLIEGLKPGGAYDISLVAEDSAGNRSAPVWLRAALGSGAGEGPGESSGGGPGGGSGGEGNPDQGAGSDAVQPGKLEAVELNWAKLASEWKESKGISVWDGRLRIQLDGWQPAMDESGGLTISEARDVPEPKDKRFQLLRPAIAMTMYSAEGTPSEEPDAGGASNGGAASSESRALRLLITLDKNSLIGVDPDKLGVYIADPERPGEWTYMGGKWHADKRQMEIRVAASSEDYGVFAVMEYKPNFHDLMEHWSKKAVELLASRHLAEGTGDSLFSPQRPVTRVEFAAFMIRTLNYSAGEGVSGNGFDEIVEEKAPSLDRFADTSNEAWYSEILEQAVSYGLIHGDGSSLRPGDSATREEAAVFMKRLLDRLLVLGVIRLEDLEETEPGFEPFRDAAELSDWSRGAVDQLQAWGIVKGHSDGRFAPKQTTTRAEIAQMLANILLKCNLL